MKSTLNPLCQFARGIPFSSSLPCQVYFRFLQPPVRCLNIIRTSLISIRTTLITGRTLLSTVKVAGRPDPRALRQPQTAEENGARIATNQLITQLTAEQALQNSDAGASIARSRLTIQSTAGQALNKPDHRRAMVRNLSTNLSSNLSGNLSGNFSSNLSYNRS